MGPASLVAIEGNTERRTKSGWHRRVVQRSIVTRMLATTHGVCIVLRMHIHMYSYGHVHTYSVSPYIIHGSMSTDTWLHGSVAHVCCVRGADRGGPPREGEIWARSGQECSRMHAEAIWPTVLQSLQTRICRGPETDLQTRLQHVDPVRRRAFAESRDPAACTL